MEVGVAIAIWFAVVILIGSFILRILRFCTMIGPNLQQPQPQPIVMSSTITTAPRDPMRDVLQHLYTFTKKQSPEEIKSMGSDAQCPICLSHFSRRSTDLDSTPAVAMAMGVSFKQWDDVILRTNQCNHVFHAPCLASWILRGKATCPVCRIVYCRERRAFSEPVQHQRGQGRSQAAGGGVTTSVSASPRPAC
ncbi:hypothetical protein F5Y17DRAFT_58684 [Xylariaceae sp. FL0594]|nr:hypothetical protein F5Y17DRAFT_58684 [Xylariaceae sp. FL0594]